MPRYGLLSILVLFSCNARPVAENTQGLKKADSSEYSGDSKAATNPPSSAAPAPAVPTETLAVPSAITGALLHCATFLDGDDQLPTSQIGCRLDDASGKRIDPASLGTKATFTISSLPAAIKTTQRSPTYIDRYFDSIFDITGKTAAEVQDAVKNMSLSVDMSGIIDGKELTSKSSNFETAKIAPKRANWVSYLYDTSPVYVDQATSLTWALDDGAGYTLSEGTTHCNDLVYADSSDWRLPTVTELRTAHLDKLGTAYADPGNMNIDSMRFGGYATSSLEFPDQAVSDSSRRWLVNLGAATAGDASLITIYNRLSVICVHD